MRTAKGSSFHSTLPLLLLLLAMVAKTSSPLKILSPILRIRNTTTTENTEEKDDPPRISMASVFDTLSYKSAEAGPDCEGALKIFGSEREIALGRSLVTLSHSLSSSPGRSGVPRLRGLLRLAAIRDRRRSRWRDRAFVIMVSEGSCCWSVHPSELYRGPGFSLGRGEARVVPAGAAGSVRMREDGGGCQETAFP